MYGVDSHLVRGSYVRVTYMIVQEMRWTRKDNGCSESMPEDVRFQILICLLEGAVSGALPALRRAPNRSIRVLDLGDGLLKHARFALSLFRELRSSHEYV
jgi:hypothetical protein